VGEQRTCIYINSKLRLTAWTGYRVLFHKPSLIIQYSASFPRSFLAGDRKKLLRRRRLQIPDSHRLDIENLSAAQIKFHVLVLWVEPGHLDPRKLGMTLKNADLHDRAVAIHGDRGLRIFSRGMKLRRWRPAPRIYVDHLSAPPAVSPIRGRHR